MKRALYSFVLVGVIAAVAVGLTSSFFSDTETSVGNTFQAGDLDLKVDNTSYYNGVFNPQTSWGPSDFNFSNTATGTYKFFDFQDIKPGDWGEDTISLRVDTNDAWGCYDIALTSNDDVTCNEPELVNDQFCAEPNDNLFDGELADEVNFVFWLDDGDNVYEDDETLITQGSIAQAIQGLSGALADSVGGILGLAGQPMKGAQTYYVAKAWCFGDFTLSPVDQDALGPDQNNGPDVRNSGILCNGEPLNNAAQTDKVTADISFSVVQARNNDGYTCEPPTDITPSPSLTPSVTPTPPVACINDADVMLVLDRSGSISNSELASLKTAALDFVTVLAPAPNDAHIGQSSFSTTASLDAQLTDSAATINAAINALVNGGFTNLVGGLNLASTELASVRDRDDLTVPDYMIVITDGNPNRPIPDATAEAQAAASAQAFTAGGGKIYVVGVGNDVDAAYLTNQIASTPADYFPVASYETLSTVLNDLITACEQ